MAHSKNYDYGGGKMKGRKAGPKKKGGGSKKTAGYGPKKK